MKAEKWFEGTFFVFPRSFGAHGWGAHHVRMFGKAEARQIRLD